MRIVSPSLALGAVLLTGFSGSILLAQEQTPAAGAPVTTSPSAATPGAHHSNPHRQAQKMAKKLGLTPDQKSKLEPILADRSQQIQAVHADATLAPQDKRAKLTTIRQNSNASIEALLTDTQKQQFEQMKASHKGRKQQQQQTPSANS